MYDNNKRYQTLPLSFLSRCLSLALLVVLPFLRRACAAAAVPLIHRFVCAFKHDSPVLAEWSSGAEATNEKRRNAKGERRRNGRRESRGSREGGEGTG